MQENRTNSGIYALDFEKKTGGVISCIMNKTPLCSVDFNQHLVIKLGDFWASLESLGQQTHSNLLLFGGGGWTRVDS